MKQKIINIVMIIMIIALPMAIIPGKTYNIPKIYILLIGSGILAVLTCFEYKKIVLDKKNILLLVFAILALLSTICSENIKTAILGNYNRYEGLLSIYSYLVLYFCSKYLLNYKKTTLLKILYAVYIPICLLGIAQYYIKPESYKLYPIFNKNACGTFGNTNFMSSFVSMGLPIFVTTYILNNSKISLLTSSIVFFCLVACMARSGWVASILFFAILIIYLMKNRKKEYFKRAFIILMIFVAIFLMLYFQKQSVVKNKIRVVKNDVLKITQNRAQNEIGSGRLQIWKVTLELMQKYPILGVGPDNMEQGIMNNLTPTSIDYIVKTKTKIDKAHNEYLQIGATIGIPALIVYLTFLALTIIPKLKLAFKDKDLFIVINTIIVYLVQAFFNISTIGIAPLLWIALGIIDNKNFEQNQLQQQ